MSDEPVLRCSVADRGPDDLTLLLTGALTRDTASERVERDIEQHYVDEGVLRVHLDLHDLEAIDLEGIAVLLHLFRASQRRGKVMTVERSEGTVRRRLLTTGVLRIMEPPAA